MLNEKSIAAVQKARFSTQFIRPLYDSYSFARIPDTVLKLLTGKGTYPLPTECVKWEPYDVIIVFLIDGFGWDAFQTYAPEYPFLQRFLKNGVVSKITSQFPSTTAAHVTTIHTGLEVGQSGTYEWFYYEPILDRMIAPLLFSYAGDNQPGTLKPSGVTPEAIFPYRTLYTTLHEQGVQSYILQSDKIAHSPYSSALSKNAEMVPYHDLEEGIKKTAQLCRQASGPTYIFFYHSDIDSVGHHCGLFTLQYADQVRFCFRTFEEYFGSKFHSFSKKIGCILTADHGMVPLDPNKTHYINLMFPHLVENFLTTRQGQPLVPAGSCRDFFLHVKPERLKYCLSLLKHHFQGIAEIYLTQELIEQGFFGSAPPSKRLLDRLGNLIILPYAYENIWWYEPERFEQNFYASHGGLTPQEMESIFLFLDIK